MPPPYHPRTVGKLAGCPRVRVKGFPGREEGFDAILVSETATEATVWGGRKGSESWRTVTIDRIVRKRVQRN